MDATLDKMTELKLYDMVSNFKLGNIENIVMQLFDNCEKSGGMYYIGELNKNDPMF